MSGRAKNDPANEGQRTSTRSVSSREDPRRWAAPANHRELNDIPVTKIFFVVLALSALLVAFYIQATKNLSENFKQSPFLNSIFRGSSPRSRDPISQYETLLVADNIHVGYLDHVVDTLLKFNHRLSFSGSLTSKQANEESLRQFDLLWTHDYPFVTLERLHPQQRINHFPGTGFITNKLTLSTTPRLPHVLKAFRVPHELDKLIEFAVARRAGEADGDHMKTQWIRKSSGHRGISIEKLEDIIAVSQSGTTSNQGERPKQRTDVVAEEVLVQEFMSNPLLIDGKKFDIGIYAVLTSVDPIRVYIYESEALLRFCAHPYLDPATGLFNGSNQDSYVVGDDYTPIWLMPSLLRHYIGTNLSMKKSLDTYLSRLGMSGDKVWSQIEDTIRAVYKSKEHYLARMARMFQEANNYNDTSVEGSLGQFFEMVRFDFIVDDQLNVFLMEANMSPNLSSRHFPPNRLLYEQVLSSYFSLAGLDQFSRQHLTGSLPIAYLDGRYELPASRIKVASGSSKISTRAGEQAALSEQAAPRYGLDELISEKELSVYEELCVSDECHMNCAKIDCRVCHFCLSYPDRLHLRRAIYEQRNRWNFKRLLPSTRDQDLQMQLSHPDRLQQAELMAREQPPLDANYIHVQWFRGKCHTDRRFCTY